MSADLNAPSPGHARQGSHARRQALPRRSTKGPLDDGEDPLSSQPQASSEPVIGRLSLASDRSSEYAPSPRHSKSSSMASPPPTPSVTIAEQASKNFGFLLQPDLFHEMNDQDMPQAFRSASHKPASSDSLIDMLSSGHFRAAAQSAAHQLKSETNSTDHKTIFELMYIRLTCLTLLDYHFEAAQEAKALQDLNGPFYRNPGTGVHLAPWELRLLVVRLQAIGLSDWRRGIISYYEMAREARWHHARAKDADEKTLWRQRLADLGLQLSQALIEMGDMDGAARHLKSLIASAEKDRPDPFLLMRLALIFLRIGDVAAAGHRLSQLEAAESGEGKLSNHLLRALAAMCDAQYERAADEWVAMGQRINDDDAGVKTMLQQNHAVCLVYAGRISEARGILEGLILEQNVPHGVTFNLATIFELTSENARNLKMSLAQKMASHEPSSVGWEKFNADFKL